MLLKYPPGRRVFQEYDDVHHCGAWNSSLSLDSVQAEQRPGCPQTPENKANLSQTT